MFESYRAAMRRRGLAAATVHGRLSMLRRWCAHVGDPFTTTFRDVETFVDTAGGMRAPITRAGAVSHLAAFYRWAIRDGLTEHDPTALVERPVIRPGLPRPANDTDLTIALTLSSGPVRAGLILDRFPYCLHVESHQHATLTGLTSVDNGSLESYKCRMNTTISLIPDPEVEPTVDVRLACRALGIGQTTGYERAKTGQLVDGVPVIKVGAKYRVPTIALRRALGLDDEAVSA